MRRRSSKGCQHGILKNNEDRLRAEIRRLKYLEKPQENVQHLMSLDGEVLHPSFVNFDTIAERNYSGAKEEMCLGTAPKPEKLYITTDDAALTKMTKNEEVEKQSCSD